MTKFEEAKINTAWAQGFIARGNYPAGTSQESMENLIEESQEVIGREERDAEEEAALLNMGNLS